MSTLATDNIDPKSIETCQNFLKVVDKGSKEARSRNRWGFVRGNEDVWHTWDADCMERFQLGPLRSGGLDDWEDAERVEKRFHDTILYYWWALNGNKRLAAQEDQYLDFILGPESPWKGIFPYLVTKTPKDVAENKGFIINTPIDAPARLLFNFLIATRLNRTDEYVLDFQDMADKYKVNPRLGLLLTGCLNAEEWDASSGWSERMYGSLMARISWVLRRFADGDHIPDKRTIRKNFFRGSFKNGAEAIWYDTENCSSRIKAKNKDAWCRAAITEYERRRNEYAATTAKAVAA